MMSCREVEHLKIMERSYNMQLLTEVFMNIYYYLYPFIPIIHKCYFRRYRYRPCPRPRPRPRSL